MLGRLAGAPRRCRSHGAASDPNSLRRVSAISFAVSAMGFLQDICKTALQVAEEHPAGEKRQAGGPGEQQQP